MPPRFVVASPARRSPTDLLPSISSLPDDARALVSQRLAISAACALDLYAQAKTAHWNVRGPRFSQLHELVDRVADLAEGTTDRLAERCVALGGYVDGTLEAAATTATAMPEFPQLGGLVEQQHLDAVIAGVRAFVGELKGLEAVTAGAKDADTGNLAQELVVEFEKVGWMLVATAAG